MMYPWIPACPFYAETGTEQHTTFWSDFWIAVKLGGEKAVRDTYKSAFDEWHTNHVYVTELCMVLNWMIWALYDRNQALAAVFDELWRECDEWCCTNLKGDELNYYYRTTD